MTMKPVRAEGGGDMFLLLLYTKEEIRAEEMSSSAAGVQFLTKGCLCMCVWVYVCAVCSL